MTACDGAQGHPILPACLSTVRCGRRVERWLARCEILVRQRDLVLRRLELGIHPEPSRAERRLDRLHAAIDASDGVTTHFVRAFTRKWAHTRRVIAVKGQSVAGRSLIGKPSDQDVNYRGQVLKKGVKLWQYGADTAKGALYARLKVEEPGRSYVHLPSGLPDEFFDQLTAERRVTRYLRGHPRVEWMLEKGRRNEALDCAGMAHAAFEYAGGSRINWDALERTINPDQRDLFAARAETKPGGGETNVAAGEPDVPAAVHTSAPVPVLAAPPRRTNWITGFRP